MNPYVRSVRALDDYELEILFENEEVRNFDVNLILGAECSRAFVM